MAQRYSGGPCATVLNARRRGCKINHEFKPNRLLNRQLSRACALENSIDISSSAKTDGSRARSVGVAQMANPDTRGRYVPAMRSTAIVNKLR